MVLISQMSFDWKLTNCNLRCITISKIQQCNEGGHLHLLHRCEHHFHNQGIICTKMGCTQPPWDKGSNQIWFSVKVGILSQPAWLLLPERCDSQKGKNNSMFILHFRPFWAYYLFMKNLIFSVGTTNVSVQRPPPPSLGQNPNFNRKSSLIASLKWWYPKFILLIFLYIETIFV